jgi:hypothetical protein
MGTSLATLSASSAVGSEPATMPQPANSRSRVRSPELTWAHRKAMPHSPSPELSIHQPEDGLFTNNPRHPLRLLWSDIGTGVDRDSLNVWLNEDSWNIECAHHDLGTDCEPPSPPPSAWGCLPSC